jgi:peptidoglycan/LPS O-acetylase OafA/YrhL
MTKSPSAPSTAHAPLRIIELDALHGIAALVVVLFHYIDWYDKVRGHSTDPLFWLPWGELGVQLFFVISGFVIFMTLQRSKRPMDVVVSRFPSPRWQRATRPAPRSITS